MFEILHFRGSDEILKEKNLLKDVKVTDSALGTMTSSMSVRFFHAVVLTKKSH